MAAAVRSCIRNSRYDFQLKNQLSRRALFTRTLNPLFQSSESVPILLKGSYLKDVAGYSRHISISTALAFSHNSVYRS